MIDFLIIACSGRALATSAKRAGYQISVIDMFIDEDTRSISKSVHHLQYHNEGFIEKELLSTCQSVISEYPGARIVLGSGFEATPELIEHLGKIAPVLSNKKELIIALKNPQVFHELLKKNGISQPHFSSSKPANSERYLIKKISGMGGDHINWSTQVNIETQAGYYFQEYISGDVMSVVFLADAQQTQIIGFNQQLQSNEFPDMPFLYHGAISLNRVSTEHRELIQNILNKITKETELLGLCGLDYIVNEAGEVVVLEVNPRPPATFELHEEQQSIFDAHISCFDGKLFNYTEQSGDKSLHNAYAILYAKEKTVISDTIKWPEWVRDKPSAGSIIPTKLPVCTVHAKDISIDIVKTILFNRLQQIEMIIASTQNAA
jgi:uncharacterized protein